MGKLSQIQTSFSHTFDWKLSIREWRVSISIDLRICGIQQRGPTSLAQSVYFCWRSNKLVTWNVCKNHIWNVFLILYSKLFSLMFYRIPLLNKSLREEWASFLFIWYDSQVTKSVVSTTCTSIMAPPAECNCYTAALEALAALEWTC